MKICQYKKIAMLMTLMLIVPLLWNLNTAVASAATSPTFVQASVDLVGEGETYQLKIKDEVTGSKYSWTSSDNSIAKVTNKGVVTSINKGTATIKCKITYPTKKTKTISCKVVVTIPAKEISISNAKDDVNGAHVLMLGETMDFNTEVLPSNTSDKVFWSVGGGDASCISIVDAANGIVTATKAGKVILTATAAKTSTKEAADLSIVDDAVIIEVVGPTATVKSAEITESNKITVIFDSPVNPSTVIGANSTLSDNIELTLSKDTKQVVAGDPGKLTAALSTDSKTLTITSEKPFSGYYGINFTSNIKTSDGISLEQYYKKMTFTDLTPPEYAGTTLDDTGLIATIRFTEPINFTNMVISDVRLITTSNETANPSTLSALKYSANYTIAADKKSLTIDLTNIASNDKGKLFSVFISGITDMAGNLPVKVYVEALVRTDNSYKPQPRCQTILRTGYNTLTAVFDRSVQFGGFISITGGSASIYGNVDTTNRKRVNYTISDIDALGTGYKLVSIGFWSGYTPDPNDSSASKSYDFQVDFTADKTSPYLNTYNYDAEKGILTLTYNEEVTLTSPTGTFTARFTSNTEEIRTVNLSYTNVAHTDGKNIIKLKLTNASIVGSYTFTLYPGLVIDSFRNPCVTKDITFGNNSGASTELPGPFLITQSTDDPSQIMLKFQYMLDLASATTIGNYKITGVNIIKAEVTDNSPLTGATVVLTVADGAIDLGIARPFTITGVKGSNNSYTAITSYQTTITLNENKKPTFTEPVYDKSAKNNVKLNFSEAIQGSMTVKVTQAIGSTTMDIPCTTTIDGSSVTIHFTGTLPINNSYIYIDILTNNIKDMNNNPLSYIPARIPVPIIY